MNLARTCAYFARQSLEAHDRRSPLPFSRDDHIITVKPRFTGPGAFIMQVVDIGLSEIDAFSVQYARAFKPREFRLMFDHSSNWRLAV